MAYSPDKPDSTPHVQCPFAATMTQHDDDSKIVSTDDKKGRVGDSSFLARIVDIPGLDDASPRIAQDRKWQGQLLPQCFGSVGSIDGGGDSGSTGRADFVEMLAVIRQLANAERSPTAAVKEQD